MSKMSSLWTEIQFAKPVNDAQLFIVNNNLIVFGSHNNQNVYRFPIPKKHNLNKKLDYIVLTKSVACFIMII